MDLGAQPEMLVFLLQGAFANMWTYKTVKMLPKSSPESSETLQFWKYFAHFSETVTRLVIPKTHIVS